MTEEERWLKVEEIVRRVVREEIQQLGKKPKIDLVNGRWVGVNDETMNAWEAAFPALDLKQQLAQAAAWIVSNPSLAPKSQFGRFLNTWLTKNQNQASLRSIPTSPRPTAVTQSLCEYCRKPAAGAVSGRRACSEHFQDAMDGKKPQQFMPGIVAKQVVPE